MRYNIEINGETLYKLLVSLKELKNDEAFLNIQLTKLHPEQIIIKGKIALQDLSPKILFMTNQPKGCQ